MSSNDFIAAQNRVAARRRAREAKVQSRLAAQEKLYASSALEKLPFPFSSLGRETLRLWNTLKGREGTGPAYRVGQVDAELLDEELLELLQGQVGEALKYYGVRLYTFL